jgi:hypothetical protein
MAAKTEAKIEDLYNVPENGKAEIVDGERIKMSPTGDDPDLLVDNVIRAYCASAPDNPTCFQRGELAQAEPALLGWRMPVDELFPSEDTALV